MVTERSKHTTSVRTNGNVIVTAGYAGHGGAGAGNCNAGGRTYNTSCYGDQTGGAERERDSHRCLDELLGKARKNQFLGIGGGCHTEAVGRCSCTVDSPYMGRYGGTFSEARRNLYQECNRLTHSIMERYEGSSSGRQCNIQHSCFCSSDSFCFTPSICLYSMKKFGRNCYLTRSICQSLNNSCENNGLCIPVDDRIDIELNEEMIHTVSIVFIHLIKAFNHFEHQHITEIKKIKYGENKIQIHVKQQFHILFIELLKENYYLIIKQQTFIKLKSVQMKLSPNHRCVSIHELINSTLKSYSYLHCIKYYPLLCQQYQQLMCFYDEKYMCICDLDRFSNCFLFNHSITYDCQGHNYCENNGQCFQDNPKCPVEALRKCSDCYYGLRCQFTTKGFVLSLDYILIVIILNQIFPFLNNQ